MKKSLCVNFKFKTWPDTPSDERGRRKRKENLFRASRYILSCQRNFITRPMIFFHCHNKLSTHLDTRDTTTTTRGYGGGPPPSRHQGLMSLTKST